MPRVSKKENTRSIDGFQQPDEADLNKDEWYCKHCRKVYANKYAFKIHLTNMIKVASEQDDTIPVQVIYDQFNEWTAKHTDFPKHCKDCYAIFNARYEKTRHKCEKQVDIESKAIIDKYAAEVEYLFLLVNGRLSDRSFKSHVTFGTVAEYYSDDVFLHALQVRSLSYLVKEIFQKPKHVSLDVVKYVPENDSFLVFEYDDWYPESSDVVIRTLLENTINLLNAFITTKHTVYTRFVVNKNIRTGTSFWVEDINSDRKSVESKMIFDSESDQIKRNFQHPLLHYF